VTEEITVSSASSVEQQKTIFLIEEDDETRRILVKNLQAYGYRVIVALDEEDAIERIGGGGVAADLVMVNLVRKPLDQLLSVGRRVRAHALSDGHTPLVVMPEIYGRDVEGTDVNVEGNDWICYRGDEYDQLKNLLRRLAPTGPDGERR
jgi:CheY-like chemotaxis protein